MKDAYKNTSRKRRSMGEINVTPFVDVMLVLLVVFMITSPMVSGISIDLPEATTSPLATQDEPLSISIDKNGQIYILETPIQKDELVAKLRAVAKHDTRIIINGDQDALYGKIIDVMAEINAAGFNKVALITRTRQDEK